MNWTFWCISSSRSIIDEISIYWKQKFMSLSEHNKICYLTILSTDSQLTVTPQWDTLCRYCYFTILSTDSQLTVTPQWDTLCRYCYFTILSTDSQLTVTPQWDTLCRYCTWLDVWQFLKQLFDGGLVTRP